MDTSERSERGGGSVLVVVITPRDVDDILRALSHRRRRYAMYHLQDCETSTLEELARYVAATEADVPLEEVSDDSRAEVALALRHSDLPLLAECGLIDYDRRTGDVRYAHPPTLLEKLLETFAEFERSDAVSS